MTRAIAVFDLDGTLIDTAPDLLDSLNFCLAEAGMLPVPSRGFTTFVGKGVRVMIARAFEAQRKPLSKELHDRLFVMFLEHYNANMPGRSKAYPGVVAAMDRLVAGGYQLAVCTNKTQALSDRLLAGLGLAARFSAICGLDAFAYCKPDPRALLMTIEKAGGDPSLAVMIGDSQTDIDTAKAAGIPVIAVNFGYSDRPVREFEPSKVIGSYDELTVPLIERLVQAMSPPQAARA